MRPFAGTSGERAHLTTVRQLATMHTRPLESRWNIQEPDLIAGAIRKEDGAVREHPRRYNQRLYRLARSIVKEDDEAEEVLQEAYLRAFSQISAFRGDSTLGTWLGRIVLNEALGRRRRHRPSVELTDASQVIPFPNGNPSIDPERSVAQHEIRKILERAIDQLPD